MGLPSKRAQMGCWSCHPFVERLIGTLRREYLDHMLFWTTVDLENKLLDFRSYFNHHRTHTSREGRTPDRPRHDQQPISRRNGRLAIVLSSGFLRVIKLAAHKLRLARPVSQPQCPSHHGRRV